MSSLIDAPVRYDLAESTSPPLRLADVVDPAVFKPDDFEALARLARAL